MLNHIIEQTGDIMKLHLLLFSSFLLLGACHYDYPIKAKEALNPKTFCNPLNLNYRFMLSDADKGIREAADPVLMKFREDYYLFASKSSGYWVSDDLNNWQHIFISDTIMPIEDYAPGLFEYNDALYYVGSTHGKGMLYRSADPKSGSWTAVKEIDSFWDPAFYVEGNRLYMYYGCSPADPIRMQVLDLETLEPVSEVYDCLNSDTRSHGWERTGEWNEMNTRPYIEGAWMTMHKGRYYLQYAAPGTEWKSYADGVYVSDSPTGPFTYMQNSPVSYKPGGFTGGAGHGSLFKLDDNTYWKAATNAISVRHMFERRLSLYPSGFDKDGFLYTETSFGDYPHFIPGSVDAKKFGTQPEWMLLSYNKPVQVSSTYADNEGKNAVDEESRTSWVAKSNSGAEWFMVDLEQLAAISAIQINYDEYEASAQGYVPDCYQSYQLFASINGEEWHLIADRSTKKTDNPHDYIEFEAPFKARYVKWQNVEYAVSPKVSLRDLRVFGNGIGSKPREVVSFDVIPDSSDPCRAHIEWSPVPHAQGYIVRYGIAPDKMYHSHQLYGKTFLDLGMLNKDADYYFAIDAFNENGITSMRKPKQMDRLQ